MQMQSLCSLIKLKSEISTQADGAHRSLADVKHAWVHPEGLQPDVPVPLEHKVRVSGIIPHGVCIITQPMQAPRLSVMGIVQAVAPTTP